MGAILHLFVLKVKVWEFMLAGEGFEPTKVELLGYLLSSSTFKGRVTLWKIYF